MLVRKLKNDLNEVAFQERRDEEDDDEPDGDSLCDDGVTRAWRRRPGQRAGRNAKEDHRGRFFLD